jgi:hypothetical protein
MAQTQLIEVVREMVGQSTVADQEQVRFLFHEISDGAKLI